jgi:predicted DNA-binding antitoxin AbrB/MazE fold protein
MNDSLNEMATIKGTVKNGVIHPLESVNLPEGQSVIIIILAENKAERSGQSQLKLSELLLLPELEADEPLFERQQDLCKEIIL